MLNTKKIGNKITEARKKVNISQAQLAEQLFITPQAVGKWERGESLPDIITLNRLADILGTDLNFFSENFQSVKNSSNVMELPSDKQKKKPDWDMSRGNWADADFSGLKNMHEKFSSSNMQRCQFIGSDMSGLLLKNNNVDRCDFSGSDISRSHIKGSNLANNLFKDCSFKETEFSGSNIMGCDFTSVDFTGAAFRSGGFQSNLMSDAILNRASFSAMQIVDIVFEGKIEDCSFENCAFKKVTFRNSTLINNFFKNNNSLKQIRFIDCQVDRITYAFLKNGKADLTGITLLTP